MAVRKIRIWPDPALKEVAKKVQTFNAELKSLVTDMFETMYKANGVGLAATQVAVPLRVITIDLDPNGQAKDEPDLKADLDSMGYKGPIAIINPELVAAEGELIWSEGCLSVPGINDEVERHETVTIKAFDPDGKVFTLTAHNLFAVAIQHEMDHLEGRVFVEYLSKLKRDVIRRKMERLKVESTDDGVEAAQIV